MVNNLEADETAANQLSDPRSKKDCLFYALVRKELPFNKQFGFNKIRKKYEFQKAS